MVESPLEFMRSPPISLFSITLCGLAMPGRVFAPSMDVSLPSTHTGLQGCDFPPKTREREIKAKESNEKPKPPGPRKVGRRRIGKKRKEREKEREGEDSNGEVRQGLGDHLSYILGFPSLFLRVPSSLNGDFIGQ